MREFLPILLTPALTAATVFIVFILGRSIFDARRNPPALLGAGGEVRFVPISIEEFREHDAARAGG